MKNNYMKQHHDVIGAGDWWGPFGNKTCAINM